MSTWVLTDPDSFQYVRHIRNRIYEFIDSCFISNEHGFVYQCLIDLDSYIQEEDFEEKYLLPYGYENYNDVIVKYGTEADQILAECIGETDVWEAENIIFRGTEEACEDYIRSLVERDI